MPSQTIVKPKENGDRHLFSYFLVPQASLLDLPHHPRKRIRKHIDNAPPHPFNAAPAASTVAEISPLLCTVEMNGASSQDSGK